MLVLVGKSPKTLRRHWRDNLGLLTSPRIGTDLDEWATNGGKWACDNDAYNGGFDPEAYVRMLHRYEQVPGCLWVAAPDVVANAKATLRLFEEWAPEVRRLGYPVALVGQDGMTPNDVSWREVDCLFLGGSTEWKLGAAAHALVERAKQQGCLVHMGRVNTRRRFEYAKAIGCDSVDGTSTVRWTDACLPQQLEWAASYNQMMLRHP